MTRKLRDPVEAFFKGTVALICGFFLSLSVEPIALLHTFGKSLANGAQQVANLEMEKICKFELEYNDTVCDNLNGGDWDDEQNEVQIRLNNFVMIGSYLQALPPILFTLVMGAISDRVGRKPLIILPILGAVIVGFGNILNVFFFDQWPLEAFYTNIILDYFGGITSNLSQN